MFGKKHRRMNVTRVEAIAELKKYDEAYANGKPLISDSKYDQLYEKYQAKWPKDPYFKQVGSSKESGKKYKLPIIMSSLKKKRPKDAEAWLAQMRKEHSDIEYMASPKIDGVSCLLEYVDGVFKDAYTRGNGVLGRKRTANAKYLPNVSAKLKNNKLHPVKGTVYIRGEVVMAEKVFKQKYKSSKYTAPRNTVFGMLNTDKIDKKTIAALKDMRFIAYRVDRKINNKQKNFDSKLNEINYIRYHGFDCISEWQIGDWFYSTNKKLPTAEQLITLLKSWEKTLPFAMDGVVLDILNGDLRQEYGIYTDLKPACAYAMKLDPEDQKSLQSDISHIEWNMSRRGINKPVAILKKILVFNGAKCTRASVYNAGQVKEWGLGSGARVKMIRSGDVIPRIVGIVKKVKPDVPVKCSCGSKFKWTETKTDIYCDNAKCIAWHGKYLEHFFAVLKVKNMRKGIIHSLVNAGINSIPKILSVNEKQLSKIPGFGDKKTRTIVVNMRAMVRKVPLIKLMHASGVFADETSGLGTTVLRDIVTGLKLSDQALIFGKMGMNDLKYKVLGVPNIKETRAELFIKGLEEFREFYRSIQNIISLEQTKSGPLTGQVFCFTGFRDAEMEKYIEANGGLISGMSRKVTALFSADSSSTKTIKAKNLGIRIITKADAWKMLKR
jgi:DNA ligase (NAD+)